MSEQLEDHITHGGGKLSAPLSEEVYSLPEPDALYIEFFLLGAAYGRQSRRTPRTDHVAPDCYVRAVEAENRHLWRVLIGTALAIIVTLGFARMIAANDKACGQWGPECGNGVK